MMLGTCDFELGPEARTQEFSDGMVAQVAAVLLSEGMGFSIAARKAGGFQNRFEFGLQFWRHAARRARRRLSLQQTFKATLAVLVEPFTQGFTVLVQDRWPMAQSGQLPGFEHVQEQDSLGQVFVRLLLVQSLQFFCALGNFDSDTPVHRVLACAR